MIVICFVNQKGGVGKTTSVVNIGSGLAKLSKRVLLIDLDPQESLSYWLGATEAGATIVDFFDGKTDLASCIRRHAGGFDLVPSNELLAALTPDVYQLKRGLGQLDYDFVLLDCSPTLGMTALAALTAAHWVVIPFCPDLLSIKGMSQLLGTIQTIRAQTNAELVLKSVIATRYDCEQKMHREVLEQVGAFLNGVPIHTVREDVYVAESPVAGLSVLDYQPDSPGARDYAALVQAFVAAEHDFKQAVAKLLAKHEAVVAERPTAGAASNVAVGMAAPEAAAGPRRWWGAPALVLAALVLATAFGLLYRQTQTRPAPPAATQAAAATARPAAPAVAAPAVVKPPAGTPGAEAAGAPAPAAAVKPGKAVLPGVQFDYDKDTLQPQAFPVLDQLVALAKQHPEWKFRLIGHTDSVGGDAYNLDLSLRRVQAVKRYLVSQGVADSRLAVVGRGRNERLSTNDTAEGRAQNRRVELEVE